MTVPVQSGSALDPVFLGYVAVFAASALACFAGLYRVSRVGDRDTRRGLAALLLTSGGWSTAHVGFLVAPTTDLKLAFYVGGLVVGFAAVGAWLYFCSAYTGRTLHRRAAFRRLAVGVFLFVVLVKLTNPTHGLYFATDPVATPFPHLAVEHHLFHWLAMGLAYVLAAIGYFMLFELFTQTGSDTRPLVVLLGLTGLPIVFDVAARATDHLVQMTYEPIGVAVFAVGVLFVFFERFQTAQFAGERDDPVVFVDEAGEIRDTNSRARDLFPELGDALGADLDDVLPAVAERLDADDAVIERDEDGETRYYRVSTNPLSFGKTPAGRMVLLDDVTVAEQYRREIERQNERLEQFANVVSHDLRNPLSVAKGRVDLEREELEREDRSSEHLDAAAGALERMEQLIEDVLTLAREGEDIGETEPVSLASVAEHAWTTIQATGVDLVIESDLTFDADASRVRQLLENLFRNAVEHDVETVTVGRLADDSGFYVADDGPGIPEDHRDAVFAFGTSSGGPGAGLGLAIVKTIVEAHRWDVRVTESVDGGARFEITGVEPID